MSRKPGIYIFAMLLTLALLLTSCSIQEREEERTRSQVRQEEPLKVFCNERNYHLVQNFQACYPEIQLEVVFVFSDIETVIMSHGNSDIILSDRKAADTITNLIEKDIIWEFSDLYYKDDTILQNQYFEGALDSCKFEESVYAVPLTINTPFLVIRDEAWMNSAFSQLPEEYTRQELLEVIEAELDRNAEKGYLVFSGDIEQWSVLELLGSSGLLDPADWQASMQSLNEEELRQMIRITLKMSANHLDNAIPLMLDARLDPTILSGNYLAGCWSSAPQLGLLYSQCVYQDQIGQGIHVVWLPVEEDEQKYAAMVEEIGMIGKESQQKELAYDVLRMMMDMDPVIWQQPYVYDTNYCPANREMAGKMLECIETTGEEQFKPVQHDKRILFQVDKEPLNDVLKMQLEEYLSRVCVAYPYQELEGYDEIAEILRRYCYHQDYITLEGNGCYAEIMKALQ